MCSEYIHKGPRSRKKEEKNVEGGENVDGMIAETTLVTCNHVAPVATKNDVDTVSVISADRSSTDAVRACGLRAHAEGFAKLHAPYNDPDADADFYTLNDDVVKLNGYLHDEHENAFDVVDCDVTENTCMLPKSRSSPGHTSQLYSVVDTVKKHRKSDEKQGASYQEIGQVNGSVNDEMLCLFDEVSKSKLDAEFYNQCEDDIDGQLDGNVHSIKSPSLRNLLQSFIGQIDKLSPKDDNDAISDGKLLQDNGNSKHMDCEATELLPLVLEADDSGLESTPSPPLKLEQETPTGSSCVFCPSCGQKQSDMSDISLESFGRTSSLKSYNSLKSDRTRLLSRNSGPIIQIVPEETMNSENHLESVTKVNDRGVKPLEKLFQTGLSNIPKQTVISRQNERSRVGYVAFSSFDTETSSMAPSTSVSNESLQSGADDLTSDQSAMDVNPLLTGLMLDHKSPDQISDRSRNVAIDSIRNAKSGKHVKETSPDLADSGIDGSFKLDLNSVGGDGVVISDKKVADEPNVQDLVEQRKMQQKMGIANTDSEKNESGISAASRELNNNAALSAFKSMELKRKRQTLRQSHSCGHIDSSD